DSKEYGLGAILLNKLPRYVRSRIYDKTNKQANLTPTALIRLLTDIVRKESTLREMEFQEPDSTSRYTYHVIRNQTQMIRSKKLTPSFRQKRCNSCSKMNHNSFNCQTYKNASERIQVAKNNHLCFNCLSGNHLTKDCTSKKTCSHCSKRHHTTHSA
ncbi:zinc knuckle, partial [Ancylostoma duodenale]